MGEVIDLPLVTRLDIPPERVLKNAIETGLSEVVVLGFTEDGDLYFAANKSDAGAVIFHLEMAKRKLLKMCEDMTE